MNRRKKRKQKKERGIQGKKYRTSFYQRRETRTEERTGGKARQSKRRRSIGTERLQKREEWVIAQGEAHKNTATADSKASGRAVADMRQKGGYT